MSILSSAAVVLVRKQIRGFIPRVVQPSGPTELVVPGAAGQPFPLTSISVLAMWGFICNVFDNRMENVIGVDVPIMTMRVTSCRHWTHTIKTGESIDGGEFSRMASIVAGEFSEEIAVLGRLDDSDE